MKHLQNLTKLFILVLLLGGCSQEEEPTPNALDGLTDYQKEVVSYFNEIALGFEFGDASRITRKWGRPMRIFIGGEPTEAHLTELDRIIAEIHELVTDDFELTFVEDSAQSNYYIFVGPYQEYQSMFPSSAEQVNNNVGLATLWWGGDQNLNRGRMYVDTVRPSDTRQLHLLREELTQSLGLGRDSKKYPDSIFQEEWSSVTEYAEIDRDLIRVLYHPKMRSGLTRIQVLPVLREIFDEEGI